jgi:quercetin dioxygenase-like cupin family protein
MGAIKRMVIQAPQQLICYLKERQIMSNQIVHVPARSGESYWVMGDLFTFLVTGAESGGASFTEQVDIGPGNGPPPHIHHLEDEQFYILEGDLTFQITGHTFQVSEGDYLYIPRQTVHSFKNGAKPASVLATFTPAGIEGFFRLAGEPVQDRRLPPPVTQETIARFVNAEASGWKEHHDTQPM